MITQTKNISSDIAMKYTALFAKATEAMGFDEEHAITSLEQYFACIKDLALKDRKYTILPLDEEPFVIDANSRVINIPADFKKHGIAIQGDEVAEILYFEIDRYFDATDLNNMEIYIQWETAPDKANKVDKGLSKEWVRDIESKPGKIIFGWPISSSITKTPGNIKFSVRFYGFDSNHEKLTYSFSTLTATALVQQGLNFDLETVYDEDLGDMIENRFVNSPMVDNGSDISDPVFLLNLEPIVNLNKATGNYELTVQAYSPNAGAISYDWYFYKEDKSKQKFLGNDVTFLPTADEQIEEWNTYYEMVGTEDSPAYKVYAPADEADFLAKKDSLYEKYGSVVIDETGNYYAVASNRVFYNTKTKESAVAVVPMPVEPAIVEQLPTAAIIENENVAISVRATVTDEGTLSYSWSFAPEKDAEKQPIADAAENRLMAAKDGYYVVSIKNSLNNDETIVDSAVCRVSHPAEAPVLSIADTGTVGKPIAVVADADISDEFTYQWYIITSAEDDDEAIEGATAATFTPTIAGEHYVIVTNHVNGTSATAQANFDVRNS